MDPEAYVMWFLLGGMVVLIFSSILQCFWEFAREVRPDLSPAILETSWKHAILPGWVILLLVGGVLLLIVEPFVALGSIVVYWLLLPISVGPRVRRRALPPWDDLRGELEKEGYTEQNYWRRGDWWKEESRRKTPKSRKNSG